DGRGVPLAGLRRLAGKRAKRGKSADGCERDERDARDARPPPGRGDARREAAPETPARAHLERLGGGIESVSESISGKISAVMSSAASSRFALCRALDVWSGRSARAARKCHS